MRHRYPLIFLLRVQARNRFSSPPLSCSAIRCRSRLMPRGAVMPLTAHSSAMPMQASLNPVFLRCLALCPGPLCCSTLTPLLLFIAFFVCRPQWHTRAPSSHRSPKSPATSHTHTCSLTSYLGCSHHSSLPPSLPPSLPNLGSSSAL